jgi:hypothetical protein
LQSLPNLTWPVAVHAKELRRKVIERIAHLATNNAFRVDVNYGRQNFRDGEHSRFRRGIDPRWRRRRSGRRWGWLRKPDDSARRQRGDYDGNPAESRGHLQANIQS